MMTGRICGKGVDVLIKAHHILIALVRCRIFNVSMFSSVMFLGYKDEVFKIRSYF